MKRLYLLRHAKSSWDQPDLDDHDRPLNGRGRRNATAMGKYMAELDDHIDLIVSSTARRARATAERVRDGFGDHDPPLRVNPDLYHCSAGELLHVAQQTDDDIASLMLVAHNPGIAQLAWQLTDGEAGAMPTGALCVLDFDTDSWRDLPDSRARLVRLDLPRALFG